MAFWEVGLISQIRSITLLIFITVNRMVKIPIYRCAASRGRWWKRKTHGIEGCTVYRGCFYDIDTTIVILYLISNNYPWNSPKYYPRYQDGNCMLKVTIFVPRECYGSNFKKFVPCEWYRSHLCPLGMLWVKVMFVSYVEKCLFGLGCKSMLVLPLRLRHDGNIPLAFHETSTRARI